MDNYYIQDDFPTILVILYLLIMILFYRITNNFWLSFSFSSVIYLIAYLMYKLWISIED
jgi:cell division protein FtsW (lipid II flippase)